MWHCAPIPQPPNALIPQSLIPSSMEYYKSLRATDRRTLDLLSVTLDFQDPQQQQQKGCLMVMAYPSYLGHGKTTQTHKHINTKTHKRTMQLID